MQWTRLNTIGLAKASCAQCHGFGLRFIRHGKEVPCTCIFRAVFRACYRRFKDCVAKEHSITMVSWEYSPGPKGGLRFYGRKNEEYMADFALISRRALDDYEHQIFRFHFLLGADWKLCCRRLNMDRGNFFHMVYRIEQKLGRAYAQTEPYGLYPLDEYFGGAIRKEPESIRAMSPRPMMAPRWEVPLARPA